MSAYVNSPYHRSHLGVHRKNDLCRFRYLQSNDVIAKFVLRDLDLLFGGKKFEALNYLERLGLAPKNVNDFCRFSCLSSKDNIAKIVLRDGQKLYSVTVKNCPP